MIPYGKHTISEADAQTVLDVLTSGWLTTGPMVERFEKAFAREVGVDHAVAVSNGTAALQAAYHAAGIGPGTEVIVPAITFVATANAAAALGATPVIVDVDPDTLLIDVEKAEAAVSDRTSAIVGVDYAGHPCDWAALRNVANRNDLKLVADACHSLGGTFRGKPIGSLADFSVFSFHPVKAITTGEGGMVVTDDERAAVAMRRFRNHGFDLDFVQRARAGEAVSDMVELGGNYRLTDFQCALGISQLARLREWTSRRRMLAALYRKELPTHVAPLADDAGHAYHLFVVQVNERPRVLETLRKRGIGATIHYKPVHLHTYYRERFGTVQGQCPVAEAAYPRLLTLPMFPSLTDDDVQTVVAALRD